MDPTVTQREILQRALQEEQQDVLVGLDGPDTEQLLSRKVTRQVGSWQLFLTQ